MAETNTYAVHLEAARKAACAPLTAEEATRFFEERAVDKARTQEYVRKHPEIQQLMHDFVATAVKEKPVDVKAFAKSFFSRYATGDVAPTTPKE